MSKHIIGTVHQANVGNLLLAILLSTTLSACATPQVPPARLASAPDLLPASPATARLKLDWWEKFNDPTLTRLVKLALVNNPDTRIALATLRIARARYGIARSGLFPSATTGINTQRTDGNTRYGAGLDASWELDLLGGNRLNRDAAATDTEIARANLDDVKASLAAEVGIAYVALRLAQARLQLAKESLASRQETLELTTLQQQAGTASALDVEQARLSLGQSEAQIPALENTVELSAQTLATLTGQQPDALKQLKSDPAAIPDAGRQTDVVPANALRQRPDIRAAELEVKAAAQRSDQARANRWPSFNLSGALSTSAIKLSDIFDTRSLVRSLLASISVPLLDGGNRKQQVEVQDASWQQATATYRKAVLNGLGDVAEGLSSLANSRRQIPLLNRNVAQAQSADELARMSYNAGSSNFQTVLESQRTLLSAQDTLVSAKADESLAQIRLFKAIGGAWQENTQ